MTSISFHESGNFLLSSSTDASLKVTRGGGGGCCLTGRLGWGWSEGYVGGGGVAGAYMFMYGRHGDGGGGCAGSGRDNTKENVAERAGVGGSALSFCPVQGSNSTVKLKMKTEVKF